LGFLAAISASTDIAVKQPIVAKETGKNPLGNSSGKMPGQLRASRPARRRAKEAITQALRISRAATGNGPVLA